MTFRAVIFDFFGTLTVAATSAARYDGHRQVAAVLGVPVEAYAAALRRTWSERSTGKLGDLPATLRAMARECGGAEPTDEILDAACRARTLEQLRHVELRTSAVPTLRALQGRGLRIGVVSDCTHEVADCWSELAVAPYIDAPVLSVTEGVKKPAPEIYRLATTRLGVDPSDCLYVGDGDSRELPGATAVGMQAVRLRSYDHAAAHVIDPIEWDGPTISDLSVVPAMFDDPAGAGQVFSRNSARSSP